MLVFVRLQLSTTCPNHPKFRQEWSLLKPAQKLEVDAAHAMCSAQFGSTIAFPAGSDRQLAMPSALSTLPPPDSHVCSLMCPLVVQTQVFTGL